MESDRGKPLAGKSTLNRLELTPVEGPKPEYKKIVADPAGMDELWLRCSAHAKAPEELILDLDATDDPFTERCSARLRLMHTGIGVYGRRRDEKDSRRIRPVSLDNFGRYFNVDFFLHDGSADFFRKC